MQLSQPLAPNGLWCADSKGKFMLADKRHCYPLTVPDCASRYLLGCEALATTREVFALDDLCARYGAEKAGCPTWIRTTIDGVRVRSLTIRRSGNACRAGR